MRGYIAFALLLSGAYLALLRPMVDPVRTDACAVAGTVRRAVAVVATGQPRADADADGHVAGLRDPDGSMHQVRACIGLFDRVLRAAANRIGARIRQVFTSGLGSQEPVLQRARRRAAIATEAVTTTTRNEGRAMVMQATQ